MITKFEKIRAVIFISLVLTFFIYLIYIMVGRKVLSHRDIYFIKLSKRSVSGLNIGQDVRYYGIKIGSVTDIKINPKNISEILVEMEINEGVVIKNTAIANFNYVGITMKKVIEITGGENSDTNLKPGDYINPGDGVFSNITGKAEVIGGKIETLLNNLISLTSYENRTYLMASMLKANKILFRTDSLLVDIRKVVSENTNNINNILSDSKVFLSESTRALKNVNRILENVDGSNIDSILLHIKNITGIIQKKDLEDILSNINYLSASTAKAVKHIDKVVLLSRKTILKIIERFKEVLEHTNDFLIMIKENPDIILKGRKDE